MSKSPLTLCMVIIIATLLLLQQVCYGTMVLQGSSLAIGLPILTSPKAPRKRLASRMINEKKIKSIKLPWQMKFFEKLFSLEPSPAVFDSIKKELTEAASNLAAELGGIDGNGIGSNKKSHFSNFVTAATDFFSKICRPIINWTFKHKALISYSAKAAVFTLVGLAIMKKISNWLKGMAEYELLIDHTDYDYQMFGCILNDLGGSIATSINQTTVDEYKYGYLYKKLLNSLDNPCFPQMMNDYSIQTGRDVAILIAEVDMRIRSHRKRARVSAEDVLNGNNNSNNHGDNNNNNNIVNSNNNINSSEDGTDISTDERLILYGLQKGVSILMARQADACLRLARLQVLNAANMCEDLSVVWRGRVATKSQTLRLPLPRFILNYLPGVRAEGRGRLQRAASSTIKLLAKNSVVGNSTQTVFDSSPRKIENVFDGGLRDFSARDKVVLLAEMQKGLYETAGQIQSHLERLADVRDSLVAVEQDFLSSDASWAVLDEWVAQAAVMCSNSLSLILAHSKSDMINRYRIRNLQAQAISAGAASKKTKSREGVGKNDKKVFMVGLGAYNSHTMLSIDRHFSRHISSNSTNRDSNLSPYSCSSDVLMDLCRAVSFGRNLSASTGAKDRSLQSSLLAEFTLPVELSRVVESTLVRQDSFSSAIECVGDEVTATRPWESLRYTLEGTDGTTSGGAPSVEKVWAREISYTHHHTGGWFESKPTHHNLVQVINTNGLSINATLDGGSVVTGRVDLVGFMNLSDIHRLKGTSYSTRWVFESVLDTSGASPSGIESTFESSDSFDKKITCEIDTFNGNSTSVSNRSNARYITKVAVHLDVRSSPSVYQSIVGSRLKSELKVLVDNWKKHSLSILSSSGTGPARAGGVNRPLPHGEMDLLESLGGVSDTDESHLLHKYENEIDNDMYHRTIFSEGSAADSLHQTSLASFPSLSTNALAGNLHKLRGQWRLSELVLRDLARAPDKFTSHLVNIGIRKRGRRGILGLLRLRLLLRLAFWGGASKLGFEAARRSDDIIASSKIFYENVMGFVERRVTSPTMNIVEDVIFNKRVSLTDKEALVDAKRSLKAMLNDFLLQHRPKMSELERKRIVTQMDMNPISEEYELELRRPIQNIVSGRIARLVLIQLQFVKKEMMVAMQAIDELVNANQVNLQLLAVTPAVLSLLAVQSLARWVITAVKSSSKGRFIESTTVVQRELRSGIRECERLLCLSPGYHGTSGGSGDITTEEMGRLMSILYRLHNILVLNSMHFDDIQLRKLQEDLRDIASKGLSAGQRLAMVERVFRSYSFMQTTRKFFGGGL